MILRKNIHDGAVSPVVGVMLMLVVTIIIAAVVSAFAGGMGGAKEKTPTASFEVRIANDGTWGGSNFHVAVKAVSEAIPTKDLKIVTEWRNATGGRGGATVTGPDLTNGGNTQYGDSYGSSYKYNYTSPLGFGPGVDDWVASGGYKLDQHFGNYSLMAGTSMHNVAAGWDGGTGGYGISPDTRYEYSTGSYQLAPGEGGSDAMTAILGPMWYTLRPGDMVKVKFIHIPTGKTIYEADVPVEG